MKVLLVDRSRYGVDTLSTHALMRGGVMQLHRWGLLEHLIDKGTPPVRSVSFTTDTSFTIPIKMQHGVDALYAPRRTVLDPILVDAAARAGAEVRYGVTVSGVRRNYKGRVTGVVGRDEKGQASTSTPDSSSAPTACGRRSHNVWARPSCASGTNATAVIYGYWRDLETTGYEWIFSQGAGAGIIPTNDGEACVFVGGPPAKIGSGGATMMRQLLAKRRPPSRRASRPAPHRSACGRFSVALASCVDRGARAGRSSATPATGRTRSARTASPTRCAMPSCSPVR